MMQGQQNIKCITKFSKISFIIVTLQIIVLFNVMVFIFVSGYQLFIVYSQYCGSTFL